MRNGSFAKLLSLAASDYTKKWYDDDGNSHKGLQVVNLKFLQNNSSEFFWKARVRISTKLLGVLCHVIFSLFRHLSVPF